MNPLIQMNQAMEYIETHLCEGIDYERMARIAGCSQYHFRRMFSYLAGISLGEYIRYRKLSVAGELLRDGSKVIDCAVLLGYHSADAFRKAFEAMHGITPSEAKRADFPLKVFLPMTFQLTIRGGNKMEYRIVHKGPFWIVGFKKRITLQFEGINHQLDDLTAKLTPEIIAELKGLCDTEPLGMLNISDRLDESGGCDVVPVEGAYLDQYVGVATTRPAPDGYDVLPVEESDWAVFTVVGSFPKTVQDAWARIYAEWFPASEYELTGGPELLWYESTDLTRPDCKNELWIPVAQKCYD